MSHYSSLFSDVFCLVIDNITMCSGTTMIFINCYGKNKPPFILDIVSEEKYCLLSIDLFVGHFTSMVFKVQILSEKLSCS